MAVASEALLDALVAARREAGRALAKAGVPVPKVSIPLPRHFFLTRDPKLLLPYYLDRGGDAAEEALRHTAIRGPATLIGFALGGLPGGAIGHLAGAGVAFARERQIHREPVPIDPLSKLLGQYKLSGATKDVADRLEKLRPHLLG